MTFRNQSHLWIDKVGAFLDVKGPDGCSSFAHVQWFSSSAAYCICHLDQDQMCDENDNYLPAGDYRVELPLRAEPYLVRLATQEEKDALEETFGEP